MAVRTSMEEEIEATRILRERQACDALLARLKEHHDYRVPRIPVAWVAPEPEIEKPKPRRVFFQKPENEPTDLPAMPTLQDIKRATCLHFGIDMVDLLSRRRTSKVCYPRHIGYFLAKKLTTRSFPEIGKHFGDKDHTTILHGYNKIERLIVTDQKVARDVAEVEAMI